VGNADSNSNVKYGTISKEAKVLAMAARLRRRNGGRKCKICGSALQPQLQKKHDPFWIICLIVLGAALAWYLIGVLLIAAGMWLLTRKEVRWVCPACTLNEPGATG
jgi:hypothetical protein